MTIYNDQAGYWVFTIIFYTTFVRMGKDRLLS